MPRLEDVALHDLQTALDDLDDARDYDAAYYIALILKLLRRLNDVEGRLGRTLREVLVDPAMGAASRMAWPDDDVILSNPYWLVRGPAAEGMARTDFMPLRDALADAAGRCA